MADEFRELDRQVERGNLFTHTALSDYAARANETEAMINGLVDYLVAHGMVESEGLLSAVEAARAEAAAKHELVSAGVALRVDPPDADPAGNPVNCEERLHICHAVCCRLRFALSAEEIESGRLRWDLGQPYYNRRGEGGYCHRIDGETKACTIYEERPSVCRNYSCANDPRIWTDFDAMELNQEWIDDHLGEERLGPVEVFMSQ